VSVSFKRVSIQIRVIIWSSRVRVESQELSSHFKSLVYKLVPMSDQKKFDIFPVFSAIKWRPTSYKITPYELKNGAQYCFSGFVNRLFRFKFLGESSFHFTSFFHCLSFPQVKFAAGSIRPCLSQDQKCPEMNMHLDVDLNLDAFWYFDGLGYYNFCLPIFGSDLVIVFCTSSQRSVQIGDCRIWY